MSLAKKILNNFFILFSSQVIARLLNFIIVLYLVRVITPSEFGLINFAKTIALYFGLLLNIGLDQYGLKELSKDRNDKNNIIGNILSMKILLSIFSYMVLLLFIPYSWFEYDIKRLTILYGLAMILEGIGMAWVFNALEKMKAIFYSEVIKTSLLLILIVIFVKSSLDIFKIPLFECAAVFLGCLILILNFYIMGRHIIFSFNFKTLKDLIISAIPLGMVLTINYIYYNFGLTLLGFSKGMMEVGLYMAPYKLMLAMINMVLGTLSMALIPTIARLYVESKDSLRDFLAKLSRMLLFLSFFIAIFGTLLAEPVITVIFGIGYLKSVEVFRILIWWLVALYMSFHLTLTLYVCDETKRFFKVSFYTLAINVILNILLIPRFNMFGLATAMALSGIGSLSIALSYVNKNVVKLPIGRAELIFSISSIGIAFVLLALQFPLIYKIALAAISYLILSLSMKILRREDIVTIKRLVFDKGEAIGFVQID